MTTIDPEARMMEHLKEALRLADQLGLGEIAIRIDAAIAQMDEADAFLRDSAARIWRLTY